MVLEALRVPVGLGFHPSPAVAFLSVGTSGIRYDPAPSISPVGSFPYAGDVGSAARGCFPGESGKHR